MLNQPPTTPLNIAYQRHERGWRDFVYCYPVVSRRSGGLSIGINLNPDKACNFDCIYCQVDRSTPGPTKKVELPALQAELDRLLDLAIGGALFQEPPFDSVPAGRRRICDIAFSGDGEPTTCPQFEQAVQIAADARRARSLTDTKLVLITDGCYLTKPKVRAGLIILDESNGEVWAKLDAGTQGYYEQVNRPNYPLSHVMANILDAAKVRPVVIQSLWMKVHGEPPPPAEIDAYCDRLNEILASRGKLKLIQLYTIARRTMEAYATPLSDGELDAIAERVRARVQSPVATFYGISD
jgi:wyosine [tRNA(Phe)-imidazoG37] synthetase (radical SAM superfamily)